MVPDTFDPSADIGDAYWTLTQAQRETAVWRRIQKAPEWKDFSAEEKWNAWLNVADSGGPVAIPPGLE
jgi:hypothetical protein